MLLCSISSGVLPLLSSYALLGHLRIPLHETSQRPNHQQERDRYSRIIRTTPRLIRIRLIRGILIRYITITRERLLDLRANIIHAIVARDLRVCGADGRCDLLFGGLGGVLTPL